MRAFAVLNEHEIPVELTLAVQRTDGVQLILGVLLGSNRVGELVGQVFQLGADGDGALFGLRLDSSSGTIRTAKPNLSRT